MRWNKKKPYRKNGVNVNMEIKKRNTTTNKKKTEIKAKIKKKNITTEEI